MRAVFDGIQYVLRTGCAWRHLPPNFPPWGTVHRRFLRLSRAGLFEGLAHALMLSDRERAGRAANPTGAILDAQAARSGAVGVRGMRVHDRAHRGDRVGSATAITVEIVEPEEGQKGLAVQPRRWVVERTFSWIARRRRLARDHEATPSSALAFFILAAATILVRRLARPL